MVSMAPLHHQVPSTAIFPGICSHPKRDTAEKMPGGLFPSLSGASTQDQPAYKDACFPPPFCLGSDSDNPGLFSQALMVFRGVGTWVGENSLQIGTSGSMTLSKVENIC